MGDEDEEGSQGLGRFISFLRWLAGEWSQARLSRESRTPRSNLSLYESGKKTPRPATLQRITSAVSVPQRLVGFLRWCLGLIFKALATGKIPPVDSGITEEARAAAGNIVERALARARAERALLEPAARQSGPPTQEDRRRAQELFEKLSRYPEEKQRFLIEHASAYQNPLLCLVFCEASEAAAPDDPQKAMKLAETALFVAQHLKGLDRLKPRAEAWCTGFLGNAQRALGRDLPATAKTFDRAWRLWKQGEDPAGLFSEAYLLDMEASLKRDQRLFPQAIQLHDESLKLARPEERGTILLNKAVTYQHKCDHEGALQLLDEAAPHIAEVRQPRLRCVLRYNQAANLIVLNRAAEAAEILPEVLALAERLNNDIDRLRTRWLSASCAAGLGRKEQALAELEQVRRGFEKRGFPFDYALASLDVALLYREEGRFAEIAALAGEMVAIFKAQGVAREAIGAVVLFKEAAENKRLTTELVARLADYLRQAQREPGAKFRGVF